MKMNCSIEVFIVFFDTEVDFFRFVETKFTTPVQIWHVPESGFKTNHLELNVYNSGNQYVEFQNFKIFEKVGLHERGRRLT